MGGCLPQQQDRKQPAKTTDTDEEPLEPLCWLESWPLLAYLRPLRPLERVEVPHTLWLLLAARPLLCSTASSNYMPLVPVSTPFRA